jgi:NitT/TauT family transport system permease protein
MPPERSRRRARAAIVYTAGYVLMPALVFLGLIALWEVVVGALDIPAYLLPKPTVIVSAFVADFALLLSYMEGTLSEAMRGLLVGGVAAFLLAAASYRTPWIAKPLAMYSAFLKAVPLIALTPLAVVWLGIGAAPRIAIAALAVAPIVFTFTAKGLAAADPVARELMHSYSAGHVQTFRALDLPCALPHIFSGIRISVSTSIIITVIAEFFGGELTTIGTYIRTEAGNLHTVAVWSAVLMACSVTLLLYGIVSVVDRLALGWHPARRSE